MKRSIFLLVMCSTLFINYTFIGNVSAQDCKKPEAKAETIIFAKLEHDFGTISKSEGVVTCEFSFKNKGKTELIVTKVTASCGCTVPDWSKEPIAPGKKGYVKATFNPKSVNGDFTKMITVLSDGNPSRISLRIKGHVQ